MNVLHATKLAIWFLVSNELHRGHSAGRSCYLVSPARQPATRLPKFIQSATTRIVSPAGRSPHKSLPRSYACFVLARSRPSFLATRPASPRSSGVRPVARRCSQHRWRCPVLGEEEKSQHGECGLPHGQATGQLQSRMFPICVGGADLAHEASGGESRHCTQTDGAQ
jgi:hypothetical protein